VAPSGRICAISQAAATNSGTQTAASAEAPSVRRNRNGRISTPIPCERMPPSCPSAFARDSFCFGTSSGRADELAAPLICDTMAKAMATR
jgi:hypothetical protein